MTSDPGVGKEGGAGQGREQVGWGCLRGAALRAQLGRGGPCLPLAQLKAGPPCSGPPMTPGEWLSDGCPVRDLPGARRQKLPPLICPLLPEKCRW